MVSTRAALCAELMVQEIHACNLMRTRAATPGGASLAGETEAGRGVDNAGREPREGFDSDGGATATVAAETPLVVTTASTAAVGGKRSHGIGSDRSAIGVQATGVIGLVL